MVGLGERKIRILFGVALFVCWERQGEDGWWGGVEEVCLRCAWNWYVWIRNPSDTLHYRTLYWTSNPRSPSASRSGYKDKRP